MRSGVLAATQLLVGVTAALVACDCGSGSQRGESEGDVPVISAATEVITRGPVDIVYEAVGTVRSKTVSSIQSKMVGHVLAVHVKEGDTVKTGQILIEIDDREAAAQVQKAENALDEAQKALETAQESIGASRSAKDAAIAAGRLADATYERFKNLSESKAVSRQLFDEAEAKKKEAEAKVQGADRTLKSLEARKGEAQARIEQAKAEIASVQAVLSYSKVLSPIDGLVTLKSVDVGDLAAPNMPLLEIVNNRHYRLEADIGEAQVNAVATGKQVPVMIDALDHVELTGTVSEVVPSANLNSRSFLIKIDLPQHDGVRSGMFGRADFVIGQKQLLTAPRSAIVERGQLTGVYVVNEQGIARLRLIKTGKLYGDRVEVLSGLDEGETVVADHLDQITDGSRVAKPGA